MIEVMKPRRQKLSVSQHIRNTFLPHHTNDRHPHVLRRRIVTSVVVLVLLVEFISISQSLDFPHSVKQLASVLPGVVIALTNQERTSGQLVMLTPNPLLTQAAQNAANDMAARGYFSHVSPDGKLPWYWLQQVGYTYQYAGQNLAINFDDTSQLMDAWMHSPEHRANILGANFSEIGVGMATGTYQGKEAVFVVQFFASPIQIAQAKEIPLAKKALSPIHTTHKIVAVNTPQASSTVLGSQIQNTTHVSPWLRIASSPYTSATDALLALAVLFASTLVIGFLPFSRHTLHPKALMNGMVLVVVILGLVVINQRFIFSSVSVPTDTQNASVAIAAQHL